MDSDRLSFFRQKLIEKRLALTNMVQRTESYGREKESETQDIGDMAVESYTKEFIFGKSSSDRTILQQIDAALARIESKDYGLCDSCGAPIQPKRLEAIPWALHCLPCQGRIEKGLLQA